MTQLPRIHHTTNVVFANFNTSGPADDAVLKLLFFAGLLRQGLVPRMQNEVQTNAT